jgi:adenosylcobinamide-phosphate synthase
VVIGLPAPVAAALAIAADRAFGEPPIGPHPVACFGRAMTAVESTIYAPARRAGFAHTAIGLALGATAGLLVGSTTVAAYVAVAGRALEEAAHDVQRALSAGDLGSARELLPALVGRDPSTLEEHDICRAVVESVAENTVDAVIAPVLWAAVGGAPGALGYRAVNTMDAMVGHRSDRYDAYGWAAARLDDAANWVPARIAALLVVLVRPRRAGAVWAAVRGGAGAHPSPNAGVVEAAFAAALGLRLGGESRYGDRVEHRPPLGDGRAPTVDDIGRATELARHVAAALALVLLLSGGVRPAKRSRGQR